MVSALRDKERSMTQSTAQIGRSGELLVQYRLLKLGIESAPMTTDYGIDLVVYAPKVMRSLTIQVKANKGPKPAGGRGRMALDWWLSEDSPAELVALANLASDQVWLFKHDEICEVAQQRSSGRLHFYFYVDETYQPKAPGRHISEFQNFELDRRAPYLFDLQPGTITSISGARW